MIRLVFHDASLVNLQGNTNVQEGMMLNVIAAFVLTVTAVDLHDPAVRGVMSALLRDARYGCSSEEQAAFLIRNSNGATFFLRWNAGGELNRAEWHGPIPAGTVAIVHTHPNWLPLPSNRDAITAREAALPVYVITRMRIARTDGGKPSIVATGDWSGL
jgi:proteasome lid subunit RPN8/RPN11